MLTQEPPIILKAELFAENITQFLKPFKHVIEPDLEKGVFLDFSIGIKTNPTRICPVLKLAEPKDAKIINEICREVYEGTYPYKEIEDKDYVRKAIEGPNYQFIKFVLNGEVIGCFKFILDFERKCGSSGGLMIKKKYQKQIDIVKAMMGSYIAMFSTFKDEIFIWYCENRTAHSTTQYVTHLCGIHTVAIFPNKDIFFNQIESDVLGVIYDGRALREFRSKEIPEIIPEVVNSYLHSDKIYRLGPVQISYPKFFLNPIKLTELSEKLKVSIKRDKFGYEFIKFYFNDNTDSSFSFLYTPQISNFEKVEYKVKNLEEFFIFAQQYKKCARLLNIRYLEVFVSAYEPEHQKIFLDIGLKPRGYIPSWKYNSTTRKFEDSIVFNYFEGKINNLDLLPEGFELFESLELLSDS